MTRILPMLAIVSLAALPLGGCLLAAAGAGAGAGYVAADQAQNKPASNTVVVEPPPPPPPPPVDQR